MSGGSNYTWQSLTRLMEVRLPRYLIDMKLFFLADSPLPGKNSLYILKILYWYICCQIKLVLSIHTLDFIHLKYQHQTGPPEFHNLIEFAKWMIDWSPVQAVSYLYPRACGRPKTVWTRILADISEKVLDPNLDARHCQPCVLNTTHAKMLINHNTFKDSVQVPTFYFL